MYNDERMRIECIRLHNITVVIIRILYLVFLITIMIIMMSRAGLDLHIACS